MAIDCNEHASLKICIFCPKWRKCGNNTYTHTYVRIYIYMYTYAHMCIYVCACVYNLCMCVHTHQNFVQEIDIGGLWQNCIKKLKKQSKLRGKLRLWEMAEMWFWALAASVGGDLAKIKKNQQLWAIIHIFENKKVQEHEFCNFANMLILDYGISCVKNSKNGKFWRNNWYEVKIWSKMRYFYKKNFSPQKLARKP